VAYEMGMARHGVARHSAVQQRESAVNLVQLTGRHILLVRPCESANRPLRPSVRVDPMLSVELTA